jgi:beta-lactamase family protein
MAARSDSLSIRAIRVQKLWAILGARVAMIRTKALTTIQIAGVAVLLSCAGEPTSPATPPVQSDIPITGTPVPGMASFDLVVTDFMRKLAIPGGAVAVMRDGKLIYARGFGYADVENKTLVQPDAVFRIASVSKTLTATAIMELVEEPTFDSVAELDATLWKAFAGVTSFPTHDLFPTFR